MELETIYRKIGALNAEAMEQARRNWDTLAKPLGSLGLLEEAVVQMAGIIGSADVRIDERSLLVFCSDNGVVARGVTQCGSDVTAAVARAIARGESTVCHMARKARCSVIPVDAGMMVDGPIEDVTEFGIRRGTGDITEGPAMTREECVKAILRGADEVRKICGRGVQIVAVGEMGIGNTTTGSAVASVLLGMPPEKIVGRGAGLSDQGFERKLRAVHEAIEINHPDPADPIDILTKVGGLDLAAMCGAFLGAAECRVPALMDGMISATAALCAVRLCPQTRGAVLATHLSAEPSGSFLLEALGKRPVITAEMRLGEGSGAVAVLPLLDMALSVYHSGQTFDHLGIEAYTPQN